MLDVQCPLLGVKRTSEWQAQDEGRPPEADIRGAAGMAEAGVLMRRGLPQRAPDLNKAVGGVEIDRHWQRVAISGCARHIERMNSDFENPIKRKLGDVVERGQALAAVRAEAERLGIDWRGKTLGEIRKLLAALGNGKDKPLSP